MQTTFSQHLVTQPSCKRVRNGILYSLAAFPNHAGQIATGVDNMQDVDCCVFVVLPNAINDGVLIGRKAAEFWAQIFVTASTAVRIFSEEPKTAINIIYNPSCNISTAAFTGDIKPRFIKISFRSF